MSSSDPPPSDPPPSAAAPLAQPDEEDNRRTQPVDDEDPPRLPFPVVGIGASAGGLEAFGAFFDAMPRDPGMAFVLVQHLPPDRESLMAEILARRTTMTVSEITDGMAVKVNHVHLIRPGHTLTLEKGILHLGETLARRGHGRPVDDFFRSLAEDQRERAVAVIMSGMGSNGTAGCQAIKSVGGLCIAQDPDSAAFPSMPRHLIEQGYADFIARPEAMPELLLRYAAHPYARGWREEAPSGDQRRQVIEILGVLRARTRQDFMKYKKKTVLRRIQRRMGVHQLTQLPDYVRLLRQQPAEALALADDLLIHVTGFFRDPEAWDALRDKTIAPLVQSREDGGAIRCWVTACSSGEEAYSLAILLAEEAERVDKHFDVKIFATDMAPTSLTRARAGLYPGGIESEVSPERLDRYFDQEDGMYRVKKELRELLVFAPQNLLQDPPFSRLDLCSCRNLLIYLEPELQQQLLAVFHFALGDNGTLFLGTSETAGGTEALFEAIDKRWRIFRRVGAARRKVAEFSLPRGIVTPVHELPPVRPAARSSVGQLTSQSLLERYAPAAVVVDEQHRIVYFHGDTDRFLAQPAGEPTRDLQLLAREGIRTAVRTALADSGPQPTTVRAHDTVIGDDGVRRRVWVTVSQLGEEAAPGLSVVSFELLPEESAAQTGSAESEGISDELRLAREELLEMVQQLQAGNEELKAANEESSSVNEELQSTNEELETSKEEMQSLNEELSTVNAQLQGKIEEHEATSDDLASLLSSTSIAVLFLDTQFRIRRFTPSVRDLIELIRSDVGRPLGDLSRKFDDPALEEDAAAVLETLVPVDKEVSSKSGRWYLRRVLPYRTTDNRIAGVVITFVDITTRKRAEQALAETARLLDLTTDAMSLRGPDDQIHYWNAAATALYGFTREEALGRSYQELLHAESEMTATHREELRRVGTTSTSGTHLARDGRLIHTLSRHVLDPLSDRERSMTLTTTTDVTELRKSEESLRERDEQLRLIVEGARDFAMLTLDAAGHITTWNVGAERLFGHSQNETLGEKPHFLFTQEDRLLGAADSELATAAASGRVEDERWCVRKDGTRFWGSGVTTAIRGAGGELRGFVKVMRDDTARKTADELLRDAVSRAEAANRMKDEFLGTLSHELRTPLSAIVMWARMLKDGTPTPEKTAQGIAAIARSAEAQTQLIDDLLDTSRIDSGKLRLDMRAVDAASLVASAVTNLLPTATAKGVELETQLDAGSAQVLADPERLQQVLGNLLSNALKFTPRGGRVLVTARAIDARVEILVQDSGAGIEPGLLPYVFDAFRQGDSASTRTHGGLGLGLAICKRLVELHGGSISARSEGDGKGAAFVVTLPRSTRGDDIASVTPARRSASRGAELQGVHVLVVEDAVETRDALVALLESAGADVVAVASAESALESFAARRPDVVLSDIGLPGEDGYSLLRRIRLLEQTSGSAAVPAVALSAFARAEEAEKARLAGFLHHVRKPSSPAEIVATLRAVVPRAPG